MEARFGVDFKDVRVHADPQATASAESLNANAYTSGRDIYFAAGKYNPETAEGQHLLAHELAHAVQQSEGSALNEAVMHAHDGILVGRADDPLEREADRAAEAVARNNNQLSAIANLAPETGHSVQRLQAPNPGVIQRNGAPLPPTAAADAAATTVTQAVRDGDVGGAVRPLRGRSIGELQSIRTLVNTQANVRLERWLVARMNRASTVRTAVTVLGAVGRVVSPTAGLLGTATSLLGPTRSGGAAPDGTAEEGMRLLWPLVPLIDRLEVYDEGYREIEQAQIDTIRAASAAERAQAKGETKRLEAIYALMSPKEEYESRVLIDGTPEGKYTAAEKLLERAPGVFSNDKDPVYDAMMALAPAARRKLFNDHVVQLYKLLSGSEFALISQLSKASEAQALIIRLRLATEGRIDDMEAVKAAVDRAVELLKERRELRAAVSAPGLTEKDRDTIQNRLKELDDLDTLLDFKRDGKGELGAQSFMGMLSAARGDPGAFGADTSRLAEFAIDKRKYAFEAGKQRILLAHGDREALRAALFSIHAPAVEAAPGAKPGANAEAQLKEDIKLRDEVLRDKQVAEVIKDLTAFDRSLVLLATTGDAYNEALNQLAEYRNTAQWGPFFTLVRKIALNDDWRQRFQSTSGDPFGVYAGTFGKERAIMLKILEPPHAMPLSALLDYTGDVSTLREALSSIREEDRAQLRRGWSLARHPFVGPLTEAQDKDLKAFQQFEADLRKSQTTAKVSFDAAGFEAVLTAALGSEPTAEELSTDTGRYQAAAIMAERVENRLAVGRGVSAYFTETDETMEAAGREFMAQWLRLKEHHKLEFVEYATLSALYKNFDARAEEFTEASKAITDMAGTIAATVVGIVVVVATGGAATPGVVAMAAAAGAGAGAISRSAFGGEYYNALKDENARNLLLDGINGALAVVSGGLAARGVELIGLSGSALTHGAARIAGSVAEQATERFASKVVASAVEAAIDGLISGAVSEGFSTMTDDRTWRKGIMEGIVRVGQAALLGGLTGLAGGAVLGTAIPIIGRGGSKLWNAIASQNLEKTLVRAGAEEVLKSARVAARRGEIAEVNRLAEQLEAHLSPEEATLLRQQLRDQLTEFFGHPPGTATPSAEEHALLGASSKVEDGAKLTPEQKAAEMNIVAHSEPQISHEPGYVDEVDLGNGHVWRRTEEGTWCRFTTKTLCGTAVPDAKPPTAAALERARTKAKVAQAEGKLESVVEEIGFRRAEYAKFNAAMDAIEARVAAGEKFSFKSLSEAEQDAIEQAFDPKLLEKLGYGKDFPVENLTLRDLKAARSRKLVEGKPTTSPLADIMSELYQAQESAINQLAQSKRPLYDKLRAASPTERLRDRIATRAGKLDQVSGAAPPSGSLDVDHIVPLKEIMNMPGFRDIKEWADQVAIVNYEQNLRAVDSSANRSRGELSWADKSWSGRSGYSDEALSKIIAEEARLRVELQKEINRRLGKPAVL